MLNIVRKLILIGFGAAAITQKKAEELKKELIKQGNLSENEGKKFVEDILSRNKKGQAELAKVVEKTLKKLNIADLKELEKVERKLNKILNLLEEKK